MQEDSRYTPKPLSRYCNANKDAINPRLHGWNFVLFWSVYINYAVLQIERKNLINILDHINWGIFTIAIKMANDNAQNLHAVCSNWLSRHGLTEMCKFLEFILENCTIWFNCFDWYREMQIANSALHKVAKQKRNSLWIKLS